MMSVLTPKWWAEKQYLGFTDGKPVVVFGKPCYWVRVPDRDFVGLFRSDVLTLLDKEFD